MITETLIECGLCEKEAKVFQKLLEMDTQPVSILSRALNMPRSSVQSCLNQLEKKKVVHKKINKGTTWFVAETPDDLFHYLERLKTDFLNDHSKKEKAMEKIVPFLKSIESKEAKSIYLPKVRHFEGMTDVLSAYLTFLEGVPNGSTIYGYVSPALKEYNSFYKLLAKTVEKRMNRNIHCKLICTYSKEAAFLKASDSLFNRETRMAFQDTKLDITETLLSHNQILDVGYSTQGTTSTLITNTNTAPIKIEMFALAWKQAKLIDQNLSHKPQFQLWLAQAKTRTAI